MAYADGTRFGYSWKPEPGNKWDGLEALFEDFTRQGSGVSSAGQRLVPSKVDKLEIVCQLNENDLLGTGRIIIDNIRGAMNIPQGSPWERAEKQRKKTLALELASKSETSRNEVLHSISQNQTVPLIKSLELAVESIRNYDTLAGEQALLRGLELLPRPLARLAHNNTVTWVAFSPDGKRLATASDDNSTRIWDVETGKELERIEFNDGVIFVTFGLDGRNLATASRDNVATLWNAETGKELVRTAFSGKLDCIALSPDGRRFATASGSMVKLWDAEDGNELDQIEHDDDVVSVIFSPDGKKFASASSDQARLFDADNGKELVRMKHNSAIVRSMAFSPDGRRLATACVDQAKIWDTETGRELASLRHDNDVISVVYSPDGKRLATASKDDLVTLWDIQTDKESARLKIMTK